MIRFSCPTCRNILQSPDDAAGRKIPCPKCGQRLQVPAPPPPPTQKTVLGVPLPPATPHPTLGAPVPPVAEWVKDVAAGPTPAVPPPAAIPLQPPSTTRQSPPGPYAALEGPHHPGYKLARSWKGTVLFAVLALMLGIAAVACGAGWWADDPLLEEGGKVALWVIVVYLLVRVIVSSLVRAEIGNLLLTFGSLILLLGCAVTGYYYLGMKVAR